MSQSTRRLSTVLGLWMGGALLVSMSAYGIYQYYSGPEMNVSELFWRHLWHVLALGSLLYLMCWFLVQRLVVRPLRDIYLHLYGLGSGHLNDLSLETGVAEISTIVDGINLMVHRMRQTTNERALQPAQQTLEVLRGRLKRLTSENPDGVAALLEQVHELEKHFVLLIQQSQAGPGRENERPTTWAGRAGSRALRG